MLKQSLDAMAPPAVEAIVNGPLVSVVVTVYNRLGHLRTLLDALARQTYQNVEILVVSNNGPRADAICAGYPNVRYIHREENSGTSAEPRNDGILAASGEYVFVVDDDDVVFPDHIATMMEATSSGVDLLYSNFLIQIVEPSSGDDRILGYDLEKGDGVTPFELNVTNRIGYMTVFAKTDLYRRFGVYDIGRFWGNSETELWMRLSTNVPMAHVDLPTTMYTIRHNWVGSATASMHANYAKGYEEMYREYPAADMPLVQAARANHIAALRSQDNPSPREPRYRIAEPQTR
jgi:glycosyltransferase involved in cell wall biosynthesis